jgi:hypothetical protein
MTDIVRRLQGFAGTDMPVETLAVVLEAAVEIERLQAENKRLIRLVNFPYLTEETAALEDK